MRNVIIAISFVVLSMSVFAAEPATAARDTAATIAITVSDGADAAAILRRSSRTGTIDGLSVTVRPVNANNNILSLAEVDSVQSILVTRYYNTYRPAMSVMDGLQEMGFVVTVDNQGRQDNGLTRVIMSAVREVE